VLGTVWIPAARSKRRSSAGACVDRSWTQLSPLSCGRPYNNEIKTSPQLPLAPFLLVNEKAPRVTRSFWRGGIRAYFGGLGCRARASVDVCFWRKADITERSTNVRFWGLADKEFAIGDTYRCAAMTS
jgi:hypothetical protein